MRQGTHNKPWPSLDMYSIWTVGCEALCSVDLSTSCISEHGLAYPDKIVDDER